jgi:hypothetical protein
MTNSELIASAQVVLDNLNANLEASHSTTGTFISGRLIFTHIDKYHHQDMHPTPSVDHLEVTNASTTTLELVAEFNSVVAQLHDAHVDVTGNIVYSHQSLNGSPALRSEELYQLNIEFWDEAENILPNAATKLPRDPAQNPDHIKAVQEGQALYDAKLASGEISIPDSHYRPGKAPPSKSNN